MTPVVRLKDASVSLCPLTPALVRLLAVIDQGARVLGVDLVITNGREGHGPTDPHTRGAAVDLRSTNLSEAQTLTLHRFLAAQLGPAFTVLYEVPTKPRGVLGSIAYVNAGASAPHFHLQVKKGTTWPPLETA